MKKLFIILIIVLGAYSCNIAPAQYIIRQGNNSYTTNTYHSSGNNCIRFQTEKGIPIIMCGTYVIESYTKKD